MNKAASLQWAVEPVPKSVAAVPITDNSFWNTGDFLYKKQFFNGNRALDRLSAPDDTEENGKAFLEK